MTEGRVKEPGAKGSDAAKEPMIRLTPGDARTTRSAGVEYARALSGAPTSAFEKALAEQVGMIVRWAAKAGFTSAQAGTAAREFMVAAEAEWRRIEGASGGSRGRA